MANRLLVMLVMLIVGVAAGCGKEIGDDCSFSVDCDPNGERICDVSSQDGYCTIQGCDYYTCPEEAVCVQFFTGSFANKTCDPLATVDECAAEDRTVTDPTAPRRCCGFDELCAVDGQCVPRASEFRYCMRQCGNDGDCREGYECRDLARMIEHGGQPLLSPGKLVDESAPKFCAQKIP